MDLLDASKPPWHFYCGNSNINLRSQYLKKILVTGTWIKSRPWEWKQLPYSIKRSYLNYLGLSKIYLLYISVFSLFYFLFA